MIKHEDLKPGMIIKTDLKHINALGWNPQFAGIIYRITKIDDYNSDVYIEFIKFTDPNRQLTYYEHDWKNYKRLNKTARYPFLTHRIEPLTYKQAIEKLNQKD